MSKYFDFQELFDDWKKEKITDVQIGKLIGISNVTLSNKRNGKCPLELPVNAMLDICDHIGKDHNDYIKEKENE